MPKFLDVKVSNEQRQLVSVDHVACIEQATLTTVKVTYQGGKVVTITHDTLGSGEEIIRDEFEAKMIEAHARVELSTPFDPSYSCTGIAIA